MTTVRFRPAITVLGVLSGLIGGIGVLTLLQQAGIVYPTRNVTLVAAALGIAWGVAVPSLRRLRRIRRINRRLAALEARFAR